MPKITGQRPPANPTKKPTSADRSKRPHDLRYSDANSKQPDYFLTPKVNQHQHLTKGRQLQTKKVKLESLNKSQNNPTLVNQITPAIEYFNLPTLEGFNTVTNIPESLLEETPESLLEIPESLLQEIPESIFALIVNNELKSEKLPY